MYCTNLLLFVIIYCFSSFHKAAHGSGEKKYNATNAGRRRPETSQSEFFPKNDIYVLSDTNLMKKLSHFVREKVIDRKPFSTGSGAFGFFECTLPDAHVYSKAKLFSKVGKRTPIVARLSTGPDRNGVAQTVQDDIYGFAIRFYTEDGNWDLLTMSLPVSTFRSPQRSPEATHTFDENPENNLRDSNAHVDFLTSNAEGLHSMTLLYSDIGLPQDWRMMTTYSVCGLSLVNKDGKIYHVRFTVKAKQKYKFMEFETARILRSYIPDYYSRDLYVAIERGKFPEWTLIAQILTPEISKKLDFDPFDPTKIWDEKIFPEIHLGRIVLNENPTNWFSQIEQAAMNPGNIVPGIGPSPDRLQQGRFYLYKDAQRARLKENHRYWATNRPIKGQENPTYRDGTCTSRKNGGPEPNYYPNSFTSIETYPDNSMKDFPTGNLIHRAETQNSDNYSQVNQTWSSFGKLQQKRQARRLSSDLRFAAKEFQIRLLKHIRLVNEDYCENLRLALNITERLCFQA
ncbi:catalase-2-like [Brevipalpus obovatus]|uniref:catalase-2-like n=1 Tax=Brevipalpus obovatus TaxID=246614 RepID=UPI003D9E8AC0